MTTVLLFVGGCGLGGLVVWLIARRAPQSPAFEDKLRAILPQVAEQVLAAKTQQLERTAQQELKLLGADTVHQVQTSQTGLQSKLEEMRLQLEGYQARITAFEKERAGAQAQLQMQIETVVGAGAAMGQEARTLREALSTSGGVRGAWGEATLKNILNACGLNEQIDYDLQVGLNDRMRPDAVLYLPTGRRLAIDAKASLASFQAGLEASDDARRQQCFAEFAQVLRRRAKELASKEYSRNLEHSLPCVVMFVPSEGAFRAALDADAELFLYGQSLQPTVLLASPSTLFPMILVVAHGWQQHKAGQQMQELLAEVAEFGSRLQTFLGHIQNVGKAVDQAGKAYNAALASFRTRLAPQAAKLEQLHAGWKELEELKPVENRPLLAEEASSTE